MNPSPIDARHIRHGILEEPLEALDLHHSAFPTVSSRQRAHFHREMAPPISELALARENHNRR
jgi:hypothetical protein